MKFLSAIMGLTDFICIGIILYNYGLVWWSIILFFIMGIKGGMSFL